MREATSKKARVEPTDRLVIKELGTKVLRLALTARVKPKNNCTRI
jgi:hypothetical protein